MAPAGPSDPAGDMRFILNILASCGKSQINANNVAKLEHMNHANNVYPKLHRILRANGFQYKDGKVTQVGTQTPAAFKEATGVAKAKGAALKKLEKNGSKKKSATKTPTTKKRKLEEDVKEESERSEGDDERFDVDAGLNDASH